MEQSWVKLHRQTLDNIFLMKDDKAFNVFIKLLMMVNKKNGSYAAGRRQLAEFMNIKDRTLYDVLIRLEKQGMITITSNPKYSVIKVSNWETYQNRGEKLQPTAKPTAKQQSKKAIDQPLLHPEPNHSPTAGQHSNKKENNKENNISTNVDTGKPVVYGKPEINELFEYWEVTVGYPIKSKVKSNRNSCSTLFKQHGMDGMRRLINGVAIAHEDRFAPSVSDFTELQSNMNRFLAWGRKRGNQSEEIMSA